MKRLVVVLALFALLGTLFALAPSIAQAEHATEGSIEATVSVVVVSISASSTTATSTDYGPLHLGDFDKEPLDQQCVLSSAFEVTNTGDVVEVFKITGGDSASLSGSWALEAATGLDQYIHRFSAVDCVSFTALTDGGLLTLASAVSVDDVVSVFLQLDMPETSELTPDEHTLPITITALEDT